MSQELFVAAGSDPTALSRFSRLGGLIAGCFDPNEYVACRRAAAERLVGAVDNPVALDGQGVPIRAGQVGRVLRSQDPIVRPRRPDHDVRAHAQLHNAKRGRCNCEDLSAEPVNRATVAVVGRVRRDTKRNGARGSVVARGRSGRTDDLEWMAARGVDGKRIRLSPDQR